MAVYRPSPARPGDVHLGDHPEDSAANRLQVRLCRGPGQPLASDVADPGGRCAVAYCQLGAERLDNLQQDYDEDVLRLSSPLIRST